MYTLKFIILTTKIYLFVQDKQFLIQMNGYDSKTSLILNKNPVKLPRFSI